MSTAKQWERLYNQTSLRDVTFHFANIRNSPFTLQYLATILRLCPRGVRTCETGVGNGFGSVWLSLRGVHATGTLSLTTALYDAISQRIAVQDANSNLSTSLYDPAGRLYASQYPLGVYTSLVLDAAGNVVQRTDARGQQTAYTVDALGRTIGILYADATLVTNTFDAAGQRLTMQDVTGITGYSYDNAGRRLTVVPPGYAPLTCAYDPNGNRISLLDVDGGAYTYAHDAQNRLIGIVNPFNETTTAVYDPLDRELIKTLGNGQTTSHLYDPAGRQTVIAITDVTGTALAAFTSTYDAVGNRLTVLELDSTQVTNTYDASYQLVNEQRSGANAYDTAYQYDGVGNRLLQNDSGQLTTSSYNAANALIQVVPPSGAPTTNTFEANGNLLLQNAGGQLATYAWDGENRMLSVQPPGSAPNTFQYAADGKRRSSQQLQADSTVQTSALVWDGENLLRAQGSGDTDVVIRMTDNPGYWGGLASWNLLLAGSPPEQVSQYFGFDASANTRLLTDVTGSVDSAPAYRGFGLELTGAGGIFLFGGQVGIQFDAATLLNYMRARYYDPSTGRFISRDPIGFRGRNTNLYNYVQNRPTMLVDPSGKVSVVPANQAAWWIGVSPPCCGQFAAYWNFFLDNPAGYACDGWIIQLQHNIIQDHKDNNGMVADCDGVTSVEVYFFEAWQVPFFNQTPPFYNNGIFDDVYGSLNKMPGKAADIFAQGMAGFYCDFDPNTGISRNIDIELLPTNPICSTYAMGLPCVFLGYTAAEAMIAISANFPWWSNTTSDYGEAVAMHLATDNWNCCDNCKDQYSESFAMPSIQAPQVCPP